MRKHYILIIYALMFFSVSIVSAQTYTPNDRDTLAGIRVMAVIVERLDFEIEAEGLTLNQIQTDVELRLRRAGIRVEKGPLLPYLYINLNALKHKSLPMFAYSLGVDFNQNVILERDKTVSATASTWTKGSVGTVGEMNLQQIRVFYAFLLKRGLQLGLAAQRAQLQT